MADIREFTAFGEDEDGYEYQSSFGVDVNATDEEIEQVARSQFSDGIYLTIWAEHKR